MKIEFVENSESRKLTQDEFERAICVYESPTVLGLKVEDIELVQIGAWEVCPETPEDPFRRNPRVVVPIRLVLTPEGIEKFKGYKNALKTGGIESRHVAA